MYSREQLIELRDILILERNADKYINAVHGRTAAYLYEVLTTFGISSDEVYLHLKRGAVSQPLLESVLTSTVDYSLAYEIIFGNIDVAPLHVNDALASVAAWRLRHSQEVQK